MHRISSRKGFFVPFFDIIFSLLLTIYNISTNMWGLRTVYEETETLKEPIPITQEEQWYHSFSVVAQCRGNSKRDLIRRIVSLIHIPHTGKWKVRIQSGQDYVQQYGNAKMKGSWDRMYDYHKLPKKYEWVIIFLLEAHRKKTWPEPEFTRIH